MIKEKKKEMGGNQSMDGRDEWSGGLYLMWTDVPLLTLHYSHLFLALARCVSALPATVDERMSKCVSLSPSSLPLALSLSLTPALCGCSTEENKRPPLFSLSPPSLSLRTLSTPLSLSVPYPFTCSARPCSDGCSTYMCFLLVHFEL